MLIRVWVLALVIFGAFSGAHAEVGPCAIAPAYTFYEVSGRSADELEESLRLQGPRDEAGARRFAYTDWTVKWEWKRFEDGSVDPSSVSLTCLATILLPRVADVDALSPELSSSWSAFIERTQQHELRHVSHVELTASQIVQRIRDEHQRVGIVSLKHAKAVVRDVIAEIKAMDRRYDAETDHGRTEGTWEIAGL
jgi:predicted secreted Zn-dependent protease